jgi:hypothetical protein
MVTGVWFGFLVRWLVKRQNYICQFQKSGVVGTLTFSIPRGMTPAIQIGFRVDPHSGIFRFEAHLHY